MKVITVKLTTNEELIGVLESEDIGLINLHEPYVVNYVYSEDFGQGMRLSPFMPCVKDRLFTILSKYVMVKADVDDASEEYYIKCLEQSTKLKTKDIVDLGNLDLPITKH